MLEAIKGYKTVVFNVLMALATITALLTGTKVENEAIQIQNGIDLLLQGLAVVWAAGSIWLRAITDSPIFKGKK
jgi:H+/gluconate symporter-like permease